ncbi:ABC transporter ATP-binding protein [Candidatus Daviesbacteria bacterium]|nr:ABC transporter ATP-binding protein [Candidatus Daviesbacteria bacterium]
MPVGKWAVKDFSLEASQGEFFCLVGPSGCGKSTLLKIITGVEQPTSGELNLSGSTSMVFQSGALLPWMSVKENVAFGLKMKGLNEILTNQLVTKYLKMVGLAGFGDKYPRELSGGQRQRIGIARALAVEPEVLLLDEPFSALDALTTEALYRDLLKIWQDTKITVIMVSHLLEEAVLLADRIGVMTNGALRGVVEVNLPRPRREQSKAFLSEVGKLRKLLNK